MDRAEIAANQRVTVLAIRGDHGIFRTECFHHADGHGFFADIEMQKSSDLGCGVQLRAIFLQTGGCAASVSVTRCSGCGRLHRAWVSMDRSYRRLQCGCVAFGQPELAHLEQPPHDFTAAGSRQARLEFDLLGSNHRSELLPRKPDEIEAQLFAGFEQPGFSATKAFTTSPMIGSGLPITPASATAGCSNSTLSTSNGPTM